MRLELANGSSPRSWQPLTTAAISGLDPPYGASGSRVARSLTSSSAQKAPVPRTSPIAVVPLGERAQARARGRPRRVGRPVLDDALVLHRVDGGDGGRAGERVAGVGEAAGVGAVGEGRVDLVADRDAAERDVAGVDALGEGDQVGA